VAVGHFAGINGQSNSAVAIGSSAGQNAQGNQAVAIGENAGSTSQGRQAVAIGANAGIGSGNIPTQADNSIILNATGNDLNANVANTFIVQPVRGLAGANSNASFRSVFYNPTTGEFVYNT
jgi:hypothetical protein